MSYQGGNIVIKKKIVCVQCPRSCLLSVDVFKGIVEGNSCRRGKECAINEIVAPKRGVTTTVRVFLNEDYVMVPVKTNKKINKDLVFECIKTIKKYKVRAPIKFGDVLIHNILNTGADVISTGNT